MWAWCYLWGVSGADVEVASVLLLDLDIAGEFIRSGGVVLDGAVAF